MDGEDVVGAGDQRGVQSCIFIINSGRFQQTLCNSKQSGIMVNLELVFNLSISRKRPEKNKQTGNKIRS